ncbi:MAG: ABC transporter permease [Vicinamibacterales bacterium]
MNARFLAARSLRHYRRTNIAVVLGVACAVTVLSGALLVGESVRASLRAMSNARLGHADIIVTAETFFREQLAADLGAATDQQPGTSNQQPVPIIILEGNVTHEPSGRRASRVTVYGVDDRFFAFHGVTPGRSFPPSADTALLSAALARELGAANDDSLLIRVARPSDIPLESLHGRRDEGGRAIRRASAGALGAASMGDFAVSSSQGAQLSIFLLLSRLQKELEADGRVNAILVDRSEGMATEAMLVAVRAAATPADLGLRVEVLAGDISIERDAGLITELLTRDIDAAASGAGLRAMPVLTYLANEMTSADRAVPYSLVTAVDPSALDDPLLRDALSRPVENPIVLNDWAARDLGVKAGDWIEVSYYRWLDSGTLATERAPFTVTAITPIEGFAADRDLAPDYPGISDTDNLSDWDPPFPVDLSLVRDIDEDYWDRYRTTPKAFIPIAVGERLWHSRWGTVTSLRARGGEAQKAGLESRLRATIDPLAHGLRVIDVRAESADAAQGSADFGLYFLGFSYFLVVSALLLAGLFFRLGIEQRLREIGLLTAIGFMRAGIRRIFLLEGIALAVAGSLLGVLGAIGYAAVVLYGLRTWWQGAVNTTALELHIAATPLVIGAVAGIAIAWLCILLSIRGLRALSPRSLLAGHSIDALADVKTSTARLKVIAAVAGALALVLIALSFMNVVPGAGAFFGAGMLLLIAVLAVFNLVLRRRGGFALEGAGQAGLARFGIRNASWRPGRSVLSASLVAAAVFLIVSVDAFRRGGDETLEPHGGAGGFALIGESVVPIVHDLNTPEGRENAGLILDDSVSSALRFYQLRVRPGDDTSCVNLYKPKRPRVVGVSDAFIDANRFTFASSLAGTPEGRANPWTLLRADAEPFAAVVDATSLQYVLHASVGDEIVIDEDSARPLRLRIVGSLRDSALQAEILVSDASFKRMFPHESGYRMALIDVDGLRAGEAGFSHARLTDVAGQLEGALDQVGFDAQLTSDRLAAYHRVENTYLTTFQGLGALGLLLGTLGLATVLARNVLERRRELALLRAVGFERRAVGWIVLSEHLALLLAGMLAGAVTAAIAILPAISERGFAGGWTLPAWLVVIFVIGAAVTAIAARVALRQPLLGELRSE